MRARQMNESLKGQRRRQDLTCSTTKERTQTEGSIEDAVLILKAEREREIGEPTKQTGTCLSSGPKVNYLALVNSAIGM